MKCCWLCSFELDVLFYLCFSVNFLLRKTRNFFVFFRVVDLFALRKNIPYDGIECTSNHLNQRRQADSSKWRVAQPNRSPIPYRTAAAAAANQSFINLHLKCRWFHFFSSDSKWAFASIHKRLHWLCHLAVY